MTSFEKEKISEYLEYLKNLPQVKEVKALRRRLEIELKKITEKIKPKKEITEFIEIEKEQRKINANVRRSKFLSRVWHFVRLIYFNYPEISEQYTLRDIFLMFFKRRRGEKVPIGDVYWQTPSQ